MYSFSTAPSTNQFMGWSPSSPPTRYCQWRHVVVTLELFNDEHGGYYSPLPRFPDDTTRLPSDLWTSSPLSSVVWSAYTCKSYQCIIDRSHIQKGVDDCKGRFSLNGRKKHRWTNSRSNDLNFRIDDAKKTKLDLVRVTHW